MQQPATLPSDQDLRASGRRKMHRPGSYRVATQGSEQSSATELVMVPMERGFLELLTSFAHNTYIQCWGVSCTLLQTEVNLAGAAHRSAIRAAKHDIGANGHRDRESRDCRDLLYEHGCGRCGNLVEDQPPPYLR